MKRFTFAQRPDYQQKLEEIGYNYWNLPSGPNLDPYWQEGVTYVFSETQVDKIQSATQELHDMSIDMVSRMVKSGDYPKYFGLDNLSIELIEQSWKRADPSLYGRFDLVYDGKNEIKMLEYNGDTPVSILECSVAQWDYIQQAKDIPDPLRIQYNMLDETLLETWSRLYKNAQVHFAASAGFRHEDWGNLVYIMDTALRAGVKVKEIQMQDIGLDEHGRFLDLEEIEMRNVFKLYPWECMVEEQFASALKTAQTKWLEPAWKMLLSNKAMLVKLWEFNKNHPLLLESRATSKDLTGKYCKKAIHGREGSNIYQTLLAAGQTVTEELGQGSHIVEGYNKWGYMYQQWHNLPDHNGFKPIIGSWIIGDKACGMSIREDKNIVTGHDAFFASHIFVPYDYEDRYRHWFE